MRLGLLATQAPFVGFCDADMATDLSALDLDARPAAPRASPWSSGPARWTARWWRIGTARSGGSARPRSAPWPASVLPDATDTQCGFKFFSGPLARAAALPLRTGGFAFDIELIAICQRLGAPPTEIPVAWRDMPGSTFSVSHHSAATLREVAVIWLRYRPSRARPGRARPGPGRLGRAAAPARRPWRRWPPNLPGRPA